jgi:hypothetical protein
MRACLPHKQPGQPPAMDLPAVPLVSGTRHLHMKHLYKNGHPLDPLYDALSVSYRMFTKADSEDAFRIALGYTRRIRRLLRAFFRARMLWNWSLRKTNKPEREELGELLKSAMGGDAKQAVASIEKARERVANLIAADVAGSVEGGRP